ncbi:hypothetical protein BGZ75_004598 [Mortierella antarctica]|nr:hypothetical protein BGZ75_004598 [Mortierella antarctica]
MNLRQSNENAKGLPSDILPRTLGSEGSVKSWNARVDQDFDDVQAEEEKVQNDTKARKKEAKKKEAKKKAKEIDGSDGDDGYETDDDDGSGVAFDIRKLPSEFEFRDTSINPIISVTPLPVNLQDRIEASGSSKKDDLAALFSQNHLQSLHSEFLALNRSRKNHDGKHSQWDQLEQRIRSTISLHLSTTPPGMSFTTNAHIRQYATNVDILWTGNLKTKLLDYLLRVVLRVKLAPILERKSKARVIEHAARKKVKVQSKKADKKASGSMSKALWRSRIFGLTRDLERVTRVDPRNARKDQYKRQRHVQAILEPGEVGRSERAGTDRNTQCRPVQPLDIRAARLSEPDSQTSTCNTASTSSAVASDSTSISALVPKVHLSEDEEESQIATDWNGEDLELSDLSAKDLGDFGSDDPFDPVSADEDEDTSQEKEPSRATLNSLQVLTKTLLESPFIIEDVDDSYVKATACVGNKFTKRHRQVVAEIVSLLRLYVPKHRPNPDQSGPKTLQPISHVTRSAPIVVIANAVLRAVGYPEFNRIISPQSRRRPLTRSY